MKDKKHILTKLLRSTLIAAFLLTLFSGSGLLAAGDENWDTVGEGVDASVYTMVTDSNGYLYVGGSFTEAYFIDSEDETVTVTVNYIARWDGTSWTDLDGGMDNVVRALAVDSEDNLYAAGDFTNAGGNSANRIARWDGTNWHPLGDGMNNPVSALTIDENDHLFAGGSFSQAGGESVDRIAYWDKSHWFALGSGMNAPVRSLSSDMNGNIYAGGVFSTAGGVSVNRIARWDGTQWYALGSGLNNTPWAMTFDESGDLFVGGGFSRAGDLTVNYIARWDGANWYAVGDGVDATVLALTLDGDGRLSVGGDFTSAGGNPGYNYIARWDGTEWLPLGSGMDASVRALAPNNLGDLFVGGDFTTAGDKDANYIAWWHRSVYPPVANDDSYTTSEDIVLIEAAPGVLWNDTDEDENLLTATLQSGPSNGSLSLNLDGSFVYTPTLDYNGVDFFTYIASDGIFTDTASVTITVSAVNDSPVAVDDDYEVVVNTELIVPAPGVLSNDVDVDGDELTVNMVDSPAFGTLSLNPDGSFSYAPHLDYTGTDSFTYYASDGSLDSDLATVHLSINPPSEALIVDAGTDQNVDEGQVVSFSGSYTYPATENNITQDESILWDFGDGDSAADTLTPSHTYVDDGTYTVTLTITDDQGTTGTDQLIVTVSNVAPVLDEMNDRGAVANKTTFFLISFNDPGLADTHSLAFKWGDGNEETFDLDLGLREFEASHVYTTTGTYSVTVTVVDDDGGQDILEFNVVVVLSEYDYYLPLTFRQN